MNIQVFGHKNPDTDSTVTPIIYAWYLKQIGQCAEAILFGEPNKEAKYLLERFSFETPAIVSEVEECSKAVIIDTNNADELPESVQKAEIIEILDHHKLFGNLQTDKPISVNIKPLACSATVVYQKIIAESPSLELPASVCAMLLAAILSDTLKFTSPTTTEIDRTIAHELAVKAGVDIDELAEKMFEAKSDLTGMSVSDILSVDAKDFDFGGKKIRIAVLETTKPENALSMKSELESTMQQFIANDDLDSYFFYIVDILNSEAKLIVSNENDAEIAKKTHGVEFENGVMLLPGIVSRKKQIAPAIEAIF